MNTIQDKEITGYTHMMRDYAYYNLIRSYSPCVILGDNILPNNELPETYSYSYSTCDEYADYCYNELELAAKYMLIDLNPTFFGRPPRGAAFALITRLRLQQASPLHDDGQVARAVFGNWKRVVDGTNYVNQNYDETCWTVAAAACKRVIEINKYKLYIFPIDPSMPPRVLPTPVTITDPDFQNIDYYRSYSEMFTREMIGSKNPEFIWDRQSDVMASTTQCSSPMERAIGGWDNPRVTQKLVDVYYMVDRRDRNDASKEYPYHVANGIVIDDYFSTSAEEFSGYTIPMGIYGMYLNRENRFYTTVDYSGCYWAARSST